MPLSKASLERLIEASPDIVVATDARGNVAYYNDGARETLGYAREEVIGHYVADIIYPSLDEAKRVMAAMRDTAHTARGKVENFPTAYVSKSGTEIPVAISGAILYDAKQKEQGTIGFAKDLREIIRKDQLAVLGEVAVGLAHEINNPLEVITNQISMLEKFVIASASPEEQTRERLRIDAVRRELRRIEERVNRVNQMADEEFYRSTDYVGDARMIDLSPEARPLEGRHILVVDDDGGVRETVAEILGAEGCAVDTAEDGLAALRALEKHGPYDIVLSDVVMPSMDGYQLYLEVRARAPRTRIALMTAFYYDKDHILKRSRMEGLEGVLFKKPVNPDKLRALLCDLLQSEST